LAPLCRPDALVDEFVEAANRVFPGVCVPFEDWKGSDAIRLLARYKDISLQGHIVDNHLPVRVYIRMSGRKGIPLSDIQILT
jgi:hypothetical protein